MAKFVIEFSPPEKLKIDSNDGTDSIINYRMVLAPFQKQTQVEFTNIKLKEVAVRFLTVVNPLDKAGQFVLPHPSDGVYFDVYEFTLQPNSQCELSITWQPSEYGNMRKLIRIEQVDSNKKYDFVILGNCNGPPYKKFKGSTTTYSKSKNSCLVQKQLNFDLKIKEMNEIKSSSYKTSPVKNSVKIPICIIEKSNLSPVRRQTYLVGEKENLPDLKNNTLGRDTILSSPERSIKRPDQNRQNQVFHKHFNLQNLDKSSSSISDDSLEKPLKKITVTNSSFNDFCFIPLMNTENLLFPYNTKQRSNNFDCELSFDITDRPSVSTLLSSSPLKVENVLTSTMNHTFEGKLNKSSENSFNKYIKTPEDELNKFSMSFQSDYINSESFVSIPKITNLSNYKQNCKLNTTLNHHTMTSWSGIKPKRPSFAIKNSPYYKHSPKTSIISKHKLKQCSTSQQTMYSRASKLNKCDHYLKSLASPELLFHNDIEDPFLKMSEYYEIEWLNRQESDMIRWLNALLTQTDKLVDEKQSGDLEQAAMAWIEASKTCHKNKPMQFATDKDLFAAQIYRQSPQQWGALRKATINLMTSTNVASVLSKLTISIEKDLIAVRDDRQIHLDLSLKKKIIDLLKCYNPLWIRIGLEAIYGQIIPVKSGSNDMDGVGWFIRKNLFNNSFVKQKFTKTTVLQVNLPLYNTAMKKFILRKIFMLIYFLDRAKEQQLVRHNPCLFKTNSPFKSSYDLLMGFCADMVIAHGDLVRRLRSIGYNLTHKQTFLDEVNYAVKSLNDLRDGTIITKVVEILFKGNPLSQKLRLPAISKLQKIHNVNLAFTRISEYISIEGNICSRDIVNGHREKILSLFWQIIYKFLTPQYNNAATKIQNWWRNNNLKLIILKRIRVKQIAKRHLAASKIQACVRGYLTRKQWPCVQAELIKNYNMLHASSTKIKHYLKKKLKLLTKERKQFIILRRKVIFIQKKFRFKMIMVKERQKYLKMKQSAIIIQKVVRGFILRKNWPQIKNDLTVKKTRRITAINTIKRTLRKNLPLTRDRLKFLKLKQTALYIERLYMANRLMKFQIKYYVILKNMTVFVQQIFRANIAMKKERKSYLKMKKSVLLIQKVFRGFMARKRWPGLQKQLTLERKIQIDAINTVKRTLRRNLPKTQDRLNFLKLKHSVLYIQRLYVANNYMKMQMKCYSNLKKATIIIQRSFRANVVMKREREIYLKIRKSVLLIQKVFRGFTTRKHWSDTQNRLKTVKKKRVDAINVLKRALRRNLPETSDRTDFIKLKNAVLNIQRLWRANYQMKILREWYTTSQYATVYVQRKFRANIAMKTSRQEYLKAKQSALLIQKTYRGFVARKNWSNVKTLLIEDKIKRVRAANLIKHILWKNLQVTQDKFYYDKLKRLTIAIQRRFRANNAMRVQRNEFLKLKESAIILQQKFRAKCAMKVKRDLYIRLKICIIRLQSVVRGYLVRKQWPVLRTQLQVNKMCLIRCADIIKRVLRKSLPLTKDRIQFLELKKSVTVIQKRFRANNQAKHQRNKYLQLKMVIIGVQKMARGYLFRKYLWPTLKTGLLEYRSKLMKYSDIIKRFLRKCLPMTNDHKEFLKLKAATTNLQRRFRANRAMKEQKLKFSNIKTMTIQFQSVIRGYLFRKQQWPTLKIKLMDRRQLLIKCVQIIKTALRKHLVKNDRHQFLTTRSAAITIQRKFQVYQETKKYQKLRSAIITVQQRFRAKITARKYQTEYKRLKTTTIVLQAYTRGYLIRRQWPETKRLLLAHQYRLVIASNIIKRFLRMNLPLSPERSKYLQLKWAAIVVQTRYRAVLASRLAQNKYLKLRQCVIKLQIRYRTIRATRAAIVLQAHIRGYFVRRQWPQLKEYLKNNQNIAIQILQKKENAASKIQSFFRSYITQKKLLKNQYQTQKLISAVTLIQAVWKGYCVRKKYQCRRKTIQIPNNSALTLSTRYNDVVDVLNKQKKNEFLYKDLSRVFWNLDTCTSLSKELCTKIVEGFIVDYIFHFLLYSNQSQPSTEAREPAIRVLINLLRYHGTSQLIWMKAVNANMVKEMIKMMKTSCGKYGSANKLYCSIATWLWIALQDPKKKRYIRYISIVMIDFKYMLDSLNRKYKTQKMDKKLMVLPSTRPTWFIGSKCQKCFESDLYATTQICKMLNIK